MDEAFLLRAKRLLDERRAPILDHETFVAEISLRQADSPTARIATEINQIADLPCNASAVTRLVLGGDGWRAAVRVQGGRFNRAATRRRVNTL